MLYDIVDTKYILFNHYNMNKLPKKNCDMSSWNSTDYNLTYKMINEYHKLKINNLNFIVPTNIKNVWYNQTIGRNIITNIHQCCNIFNPIDIDLFYCSSTIYDHIIKTLYIFDYEKLYENNIEQKIRKFLEICKKLNFTSNKDEEFLKNLDIHDIYKIIKKQNIPISQDKWWKFTRNYKKLFNEIYIK